MAYIYCVDHAKQHVAMRCFSWRANALCIKRKNPAVFFNNRVHMVLRLKISQPSQHQQGALGQFCFLERVTH